MKTFTNAEWFHIKGHGDVASVRSDEHIDKVGYWQAEHFSEAMIDGVVYKIIGVDSYAIDHISIGHPIGLLVEGGRRGGDLGNVFGPQTPEEIDQILEPKPADTEGK